MKLSPYPAAPQSGAHKAQNAKPKTKHSGKPMLRSPAATFGDEPYFEDDKDFIRWIPLVVPLFAVMLALCVYFIFGTVIARP